MKPDIKRTAQILKKFQDKRILVVGDVMLDHYVVGIAERISPEAPVPVVKVKQEYSRLGGAANVALNIRELGGHAMIAGAIGNDEAGEKVKELFINANVDISALLSVNGHKTTIKTRIMAGHQQIVRVDMEDSWDRLPAFAKNFMLRLDACLEMADAVIIEDYGKGIVSQKIVNYLMNKCHRKGIAVSLDPKYNKLLVIKGLRLATPNYREACFAAGIDVRGEENPIAEGMLEKIGKVLRKKWDVELLMITLGPFGMFLLSKDGRKQIIPTRAREVYDVSGAGDTVIASATLALSAGVSDLEAAAIANYAAGVVVGKWGTATCKPSELLECMRWDSAKNVKL